MNSLNIATQYYQVQSELMILCLYFRTTRRVVPYLPLLDLASTNIMESRTNLN